MTPPPARPEGGPLLTLVALVTGARPDEAGELAELCATPQLAGCEVLVGADTAGLGAVSELLLSVGDRARAVTTANGRVGPVLAAVRTAYVAAAPLGADRTAAATRLARCVEGLEANPGATLAGSGRSDLGRDVPTLLEPRALAEAALAGGRSPRDGFATVVWRVAAIGVERAEPGYECGGEAEWEDLLFLRVLLRGLLWCDARLPEAGDALDGRAGAPRAAGARLLDEARRHGCVATAPEDGRRLSLTAIVLADDPGTLRGGRLLATATSRRAAAIVERVVVLEAGEPAVAAPAPSRDGVEWRHAPWPDATSRLGELAGTSGPAVALFAGEELVVADRGQFTTIVASAACRPIALRTPAGCELRVAGACEITAGSATAPATSPPAWSARIEPLGGSGDWLSVAAVPRPAHGGAVPRFAVLAPDYTGGSGGSVALHRLCDLLNARGCDASVVPMEARGLLNPAWRTPLASFPVPLPDDVVAIYPEVVVGNPLGARRVVRWLLNRPGRLNGGRPMQQGPEDLLVTYDPQIDASLPVLWVPIIDPTVFFPKDHPGRGRLLWVGKGAAPADIDRSATTLVSRSWPRSKRELADALRGADVFVSCDWLTALIGEALMCATPVVLVDGQEWAPEDLDRFDPAARRAIARSSEGDEGIERARAGAATFHSAYTRRYELAANGVEAFVALVEEHFRAG